MKIVIIKGKLETKDYGENSDALFIGEMEEPICQYLQNKIEDKTVTVRYWTSKEEKPIEELESNQIKILFGDFDADYSDAYSEITGYLWTDEWLNVGGHNLLDELKTFMGKYLFLQIEIHE
jgi:hypothetical protein